MEYLIMKWIWIQKGRVECSYNGREDDVMRDWKDTLKTGTQTLQIRCKVTPKKKKKKKKKTDF